MTITDGFLARPRTAPQLRASLAGISGPGGKNQVKLANILGSAICPLAESPVSKGGDLTVGVCHLHGSQAEEWNCLRSRSSHIQSRLQNIFIAPDGNPILTE